MKYLELFKNGFDSTVSEKIKPSNYPYVAYSPSEGFAFSIIPNEDGTMYTIYKVVSKDISNCTYNMVDLGLPSGLKWADRNVGAVSPEDFGSYFQWGDTNAYTFDGVGEVTAAELAELLNPIVSPELEMEITTNNVGIVLEQLGITGTDLTNLPDGVLLIFPVDKEFNWNSYFDTTDSGSTFNKYNNNGGLTVIEPIDDAAAVHMGSQYRMPTSIEIQELINNTTLTFIDLSGNEYVKGIDTINIEPRKLKGVRFIGSTGNSIFIPAAGSCNEYLLEDTGVGGILWSSSLWDDCDSEFYENCDENARFFSFSYNGSILEYGFYRYCGNPIRGVQA